MRSHDGATRPEPLPPLHGIASPTDPFRKPSPKAPKVHWSIWTNLMASRRPRHGLVVAATWPWHGRA